MLKWSLPAHLTTSIFAMVLPVVLGAVDPAQLQQHLKDGAGILGTYSTKGRLTDWMAVLEDSEPLQSVNLPGTHDSAAWNPSGLTRPILQCQDKPIFDQLNAGIRFFDIRTGSNEGKLQLYHADYLLDETASLEDVFWGFYHFLDEHPTESLMVSVKVDHGPTDAAVQQALQALFTSAPGSDYWITAGTLGALGEARGKIVLFRRFGWDSESTLGLDMTQWKDNDPDFRIAYTPEGAAFVEDYYMLNLGDVSADAVVQAKLQAVTGHLEGAAGSENATQLFVTFASGGGQISSQYVTPKVLAAGSTSTNSQSATKGVNALTLPWLQQRKGARFGVVLYDFYATPTDLVLATIGSDKVTPNATAEEDPSPSQDHSGGQQPPNGAAATGPHVPLFLAGASLAALSVML
ncbi:PLC-like phosphodiesterase [Auricularia subglabra TFB-10046 SS5]|nr:PLC-like phosphodiesterase [Auricularia subglabra TFB-10046 SS5]